MRFDGIHHISAMTGDARGNLDFYTRVMGLRLVAKTVNRRSVRLSPVLRRRQSQSRHRSHLLRFSRSSRAPRDQLDFAHRLARCR